MKITALKQRFLNHAVDKITSIFPKAKNITFRVTRQNNGDYQVMGRARYFHKSFVAKKTANSFTESVRSTLQALMRQMERSGRAQFQLIAKSPY